ncbi:hypothetical protein, partial [Zoogloea sp.]|uniref:hypothetical protein n=1 Tax=Zoogloea sp. TaxID=49181 RepID=UPI0025833F54
MGFEIKDLAGFSDPLTKLVDVVSKGIGSTFRPGAMRREADAEAYKIRALAAAQASLSVFLCLRPTMLPERNMYDLEETEGSETGGRSLARGRVGMA